MDHTSGHGSVIRLSRVQPVQQSAPQPVIPPPPKEPRESAKQSRIPRRTLLWALLALVATLVVVVGVGALLRSSSPVTSVSSTGTGTASGVRTDVAEAVAKLMLVPAETPTVATVSDLAPLRGQAFFANAQLGDAVLMYPKAGRAILYRPTTNMLIEVAPIALDQ